MQVVHANKYCNHSHNLLKSPELGVLAPEALLAEEEGAFPVPIAGGGADIPIRGGPGIPLRGFVDDTGSRGGPGMDPPCDIGGG